MGDCVQLVAEQPTMLVNRTSSVYVGFGRNADGTRVETVARNGTEMARKDTVYGFGETATDDDAEAGGKGAAAEELLATPIPKLTTAATEGGTGSRRFAAAGASRGKQCVQQTPLPANPICGWGNSVTIKRQIPALTLSSATFCRRFVRCAVPLHLVSAFSRFESLSLSLHTHSLPPHSHARTLSRTHTPSLA
jgi:hypothetical protein